MTPRRASSNSRVSISSHDMINMSVKRALRIPKMTNFDAKVLHNASVNDSCSLSSCVASEGGLDGSGSGDGAEDVSGSGSGCDDLCISRSGVGLATTWQPVEVVNEHDVARPTVGAGSPRTVQTKTAFGQMWCLVTAIVCVCVAQRLTDLL